MSEPEITFEEWFGIISNFESSEAGWDTDDRVHALRPQTVASYLERLLSNAHILLPNIAPDRLAWMIWFFNGSCSSYWHDVRSLEVPIQAQIATVRALGTFYKAFLDRYFKSTNKDLTEAESAVYMMWDMDCLEGAAMFPGGEHLVEPIFEVLGKALRCKSKVCQESALHGLGHLEPYHSERVHREIDWALSQNGHLHPSLKSYACDARKGCIQ